MNNAVRMRIGGGDSLHVWALNIVNLTFEWTWTDCAALTNTLPDLTVLVGLLGRYIYIYGGLQGNYFNNASNLFCEFYVIPRNIYPRSNKVQYKPLSLARVDFPKWVLMMRRWCGLTFIKTAQWPISLCNFMFLRWVKRKQTKTKMQMIWKQKLDLL